MKNSQLAVFSTLRLARSLPPRGALRWLGLIAAFALPFADGLRAEAPPTTVHISPAGVDIEGLRNFGLQWNAVPNATYLLERAGTLAPGSPWRSLDAVRPTDAVGSYQLAVMATDTSGFYRLVLPQPQITGVEPAVVEVSVPNAQIYILGQCLPANALVLINGLAFTPTIINSGGVWARVSLNGLPPGQPWFDLTIVDSGTGAVVATLPHALLGVDASSPYLLGPPEAPPTAPARIKFQARSKQSEAKSNSKAMFTAQRSVGDKIRQNDEVLFEIQDCKKGLNAVNVKLARVAGGGGHESSSRQGDGIAVIGNPGQDEFFVRCFSGEVSQQVVDLAVEGRGLDFVWARTYNSRIGRTGASANGWTFSYDVNIQPLGGDMVVRNGTGRADTFKLQTNGVFTCPEFFSEGTLTGGVFRLTFADTGFWEFNPLVGAATDGKLARIQDRNGNAILLNYDASGRLTQIVDALGRTNTVGYDIAGRLASVTDFSGRTVTYQYYQGLPGEQGGAGDLASVTSPPVTGTPHGNDFPTGKTTTYTYSTGYLDDHENHLLLSVIDASGQTIRSYVYQHNETDFEFLRCISVQHWTNTPAMISYLPQAPTPANQFATLRCVVNDPVGDVTECFFDARNRPVKMQEFTGRATPGLRVSDTANRPAGKVRPGDPDSYETRWSWNHDSLCTREVGPSGQQVQCVYESDFDPATRARKRADRRVVRERASSPVDLDGDGSADVTERVWRYEYDPRFGSDPMASRGVPKGSYPIVRMGHGMAAAKAKGVISWSGSDGDDVCESMVKGNILGELTGSTDSTVPKAKVITDRDTGRSKGFGFVISATDPRGTVTEGSYDSKGNRVKVKFPWMPGAEADFAYNGHGELTAITNAADAHGRRSVDTFAYAQGQVVQCVEDAGAGGLAITTSYEYDARGNLTRGIDPRGNDWLCTYNSLDQPVQTESAALGGGGPGGYRIKTQFAYDANDHLTLVAEENRDAAGTPGMNAFWRTQFVYDGGQRLTGCWRDKNGALVLRCTEVAYNAANQIVLYRSPEAVNGNDASNTVAFAYDERGLDYRTIAAPGSPVQSTSQFDYDANGNVTRVSEGLEGTPSITTMEYDGFAGSAFRKIQNEVVLLDIRENFAELQRLRGGKGLGGIGRFAATFGGSFASLHFERGDMDRPIVLGSEWGSSSSSRLKVWQLMQGQNATSESRGRFEEAVRTENVSSRISKITDPMGNVTTFHHDANDNLKVVRHFGQMNDVPGSAGNLRLAQSRYEYDGLDRPVRSRDSFFSLPSQAPIGDGERTTTFAYAPNGECTSITDDLGRVTSYAYDTVGRPSSVTSPGGKSVAAVLRDQAGNVTQTTQTDTPDLGGPPQVFAWANVYDALNRPISTTDNVGNSNLFTYDSRDNCVSTTDPNGNVTVYGYDGLSRIVQHAIYQGQESLGIVVSSAQFAYDDNDRCTSSTDANGNVTLSAYDALDRLTQTTQADGTHHTFVWDYRSHLIQEADANGTVINHAYDLNGRCISNNITPGAGVAATTMFETFAYDGASRLVSANNDGAGCTFAYDSLGNGVGETGNGVATTSTYDALGNRLSLTYPGGRVLTYAYDVLDQCTNIVETDASLASFSRAGPGRVARVLYGNGTSTDVTYDGIAGTPNAPGDFGHGQVSSITHRPAAGSPALIAVNLRCDPNGNKTLRSDTLFAPAIPRTNTLGLQYDAADRLTRATVISDLTVLRDTVYGLDLMGNRTSVTGAASCSGAYVMDGLAPGALDFQMNQYTTTPCDARSYDDNGNLVSRSSAVTGPVTYQYDFAGRLVQVQSVDFSGGAAVISTSTYAYDALSRRVSKTVSSGTLPPVTTAFLHDGDGVIEERVGNTVSRAYCNMTTDGGGWTAVFAFTATGAVQYYHCDDLGNTLALTDASGAVIERYDYDDYGAVTFLTSAGLATGATSSAVGNVYCWGGLRLDPETGLHNNDGGGFHEPQTGRAVRGKVKVIRDGGGGYSAVRGKVKSVRDMGSGRAAGNNPWSGGGGGSPSEMKKGTVKFFNEAKGFGW